MRAAKSRNALIVSAKPSANASALNAKSARAMCLAVVQRPSQGRNLSRQHNRRRNLKRRQLILDLVSNLT